LAFPTELRFIARAEEQLGRKLPGSLVAHLLRVNGGEVLADDDAWTVHPVFDDADRKRAGRTASSIVRETMAAQAWRGFPAGAACIAANGSGDLLVLLPGSDGATFGETVFVWEHETGQLRAIADRFEDLETAA